MNSNYEWQKHQANERVQARLQEADAHRQAKQAKQGNGRSQFPLPLRIVIPALVGIFVALWLLTSCTPDADMMENKEVSASYTTGMTMADKIQFQDKRDVYLREETVVNSSQPVPSLTMADRIRFQDRLWEQNQSQP
ncbi:MAG: hypothetical protein IAF02_24635 [Anaerolineae bacterium]|nr:hypothetical protein [Anaerolineae bacterium]